MDGPSVTRALLQSPQSVSVDPLSGVMYISDSGNNAVRMLNTLGQVLTVAGGPVSLSGSVSSSSLSSSSGYVDGVGNQARFGRGIQGLVAAPWGAIYVADSSNGAIRAITPLQSRPLLPMADPYTVTSLAAGPVNNIGGASSPLVLPGNVSDVRANLQTGEMYFVQPSLNSVSMINSLGSVVLLPMVVSSSDSLLLKPQGLDVSQVTGAVYVADTGRHRIRMINTLGGALVSIAGGGTLAGSSSSASSGSSSGAGFADGPGQTLARFSSPCCVALLSYPTVARQLYMFATSSSSSSTSTSSPSASLSITDLTAGSETMFVSDSGNHAIRMITSMGLVMTVAGRGTVSGYADGVGSYALFRNPGGIAVGSCMPRSLVPTLSPNAGCALYVADTGNHRIRMLNTLGVVSD